MKCEKCKVNEAEAMLYAAVKIVKRVARVAEVINGKKFSKDIEIIERIPVVIKNLHDRLEAKSIRKSVCRECIPKKFNRIGTFAFQELELESQKTQ